MQILVLESSSVVRRFIAEELSWGKYTVLEASTPAEARAILLNTPEIALVTLGTVLAGCDGFEFLAAINAPDFQAALAPMDNDGVPAIFITSNDNDADRLRGYHIGAADFIEKPWPKGQLLARVDLLLGCSTEMSGLSALVVDRSRTSRRFVRSCLGRLGVTVHEADDGDTALSFLRSNRVDLVLTDLNMPRLGGDALCLKIRRELHLPNLPVIFLSANEDRAAILALFKIGATDYIAKPFMQEELMARLKVHLEREMLTRTLHEVAGIDLDQSISNVIDREQAVTRAEAQTGEAPRWRVLLVDDAPINLAVGSKLLKKMGCEVETATSGQQALDMFLLGAAGRYDMVLMDLMMPGVNGLEATRAIRRWEAARDAGGAGPGSAVPIVALTATHEDKQLAACLAAGMNDFLTKPFRVDKVRASLERWAVVLV
jgi:CheY-like chemotaxis protein